MYKLQEKVRLTSAIGLHAKREGYLTRLRNQRREHDRLFAMAAINTKSAYEDYVKLRSAKREPLDKRRRYIKRSLSKFGKLLTSLNYFLMEESYSEKKMGQFIILASSLIIHFHHSCLIIHHSLGIAKCLLAG